MMLVCIGAIVWHRALLSERGSADLALGSVLRRSGTYFRVSILLSLWWLVPVFAVGTIFSQLAGSISGTEGDALLSTTSASGAGDVESMACLICLSIFLALALLAVVPFALFNRLALVLPSIALDRPRLHFRASWRATRRNTWRIFLVFLLALLPNLVASMVICLFEPSGKIQYVAHSGALALVGGLTGIVLISALSLTYKFFFIDTAQDATSGPGA